MEVKVNREIRSYTESMFFGLSLRQFIFSVLACGAATSTYFLLKAVLGTEIVSWLCILAALPFAVMKFVKYNGHISQLEINEVVDTLKSGWITTGLKTKRLEQELSH